MAMESDGRPRQRHRLDAEGGGQVKRPEAAEPLAEALTRGSRRRFFSRIILIPSEPGVLGIGVDSGIGGH